MEKIVRTCKIEALRENDYNPRIIKQEAIDLVAESIKQTGYISPIITDEGGIILAGHTRYKALQQLGYTEVETIAVTGLNETQKKKFALLDNKTAEYTYWDSAKLDNVLKEINDYDFNIEFRFLSGAEEIDFDNLSEEVTIDEHEKGEKVVEKDGEVIPFEEIEKLKNKITRDSFISATRKNNKTVLHIWKD